MPGMSFICRARIISLTSTKSLTSRKLDNVRLTSPMCFCFDSFCFLFLTSCVDNVVLSISSETSSIGEFAKKGCGGAGPFPAFRKLNCGSEIPSDAWSFYNEYASNCLSGSDGIAPVPAPTPNQPVGPSPVAPSPVSTPAPVPSSGGADTPTLKPYVPPDASPYKPADSESNKDEASSDKKKKSHWFRNLVLLGLVGAGGYYYYKRRFDSFNFVQYRRNRLFGGGGYSAAPMGENEMYSSLNNSTTFEPPSLPPTPTSMGDSSMGGMGGMMSNMMPQGMGMQQQQQPQGGFMGNMQGGGMFQGMQMS